MKWFILGQAETNQKKKKKLFFQQNQKYFSYSLFSKLLTRIFKQKQIGKHWNEGKYVLLGRGKSAPGKSARGSWTRWGGNAQHQNIFQTAPACEVPTEARQLLKTVFLGRTVGTLQAWGWSQLDPRTAIFSGLHEQWQIRHLFVCVF